MFKFKFENLHRNKTFAFIDGVLSTLVALYFIRTIRNYTR